MKVFVVMWSKTNKEGGMMNAGNAGAFSNKDLAVEQIRRLYDEERTDYEKHAKEMAPGYLSELINRPDGFEFTKTIHGEYTLYTFVIDEVTLNEFV